MKTCDHFEKQLVAYLHNELSGADLQALETHLDTCGACNTELEAERATLELLGDALEAAPCPHELAPWDLIPKKKGRFAEYWYTPGFRATLASAAVCSIFIFLSLNIVVFQTLKKQEVSYEEVEVNFKTADTVRPKLDLKKLQIPTSASKDRPRPKLRAPMVADKEPAVPAIPMPEMEAMKGGFGGMKEGLAGLGFGGPMVEQEAHYTMEQYDQIPENTFQASIQNPLSTFSVDVDRAAYANVRRFLTGNQLPPADVVRIEGMVNYFDYDYPAPRLGDEPFVVSMEVAQCPWNKGHQLALIGLQGLEIETKDLPPNNLVFLLDVSGSMREPSKLPMLKSAMRLLVDQLRSEDRVSIVVYAGATGIVLEPTASKSRILTAIDQLGSGGATTGGTGIELAYKTAMKSFMKDGNNRVILASDGDFDMGIDTDGALARLIEEKRKAGVYLSVLSFGTDNYNRSRMMKLAYRGNGNYSSINDILEAKKVLINEMGGTLTTIAEDVNIQVEFNPREIKAYRLIGYENRQPAKRDSGHDETGARELGAGHAVTALYELVPARSNENVPISGKLKYQRTRLTNSDELMTVKLRYRKPGGATSKLIVKSIRRDEFRDLEAADNIGFASAVAEFGLLLRDSEFKGSASYRDVLIRARETRGRDSGGYRAEFIRLVERAQLLDQDNR